MSGRAANPRTIAVVTVGRSDYGHYVPLLRKISQDPELRLRLIVAGMHLAPAFGSTVQVIEADGFAVDERVEISPASDTAAGTAASMGMGIMGYAEIYARRRPDLLVLFGDRFEMYAAAVAAVPFTLPIAHIAGGELTQGAMDDALRHSLTKLSHLHFVSTDAYAQRVRQLGEEAWRVTVAGALSLDQLRTLRRMTRQELEARLGMSLEPAPLLVTYHPVTLERVQTSWQAQELLHALDPFQRPIIFTLPNADPQHDTIRRAIAAFAQRRPQARLIDNLGTQGYFSLMALAAAMVGNSSSGIIEAPSFGLPVVNVGTRQEGRLRAENVIDVDNDRRAIAEGIARAIQPSVRERLRGCANPYGQGRAAEIIHARLKSVPLDDRLIRKRFVDAAGDPSVLPEPQMVTHGAL